MKEINELNGRLLGVMKDETPEEGYAVTREWCASEFEGVPDDLQQEIRVLAERIGKAIPDDFGFTLIFGEGEASLSLEYENGAMSGGFRSHEWEKHRSIFEQLESFDWDEERAWFVQGTEMFDHVATAARMMPVSIPSTKFLQRNCREEVKAFIKERRKNASKVHVLSWQYDDGATDEFNDLESFRRELPNMMTVGCHVIAVVAAGKPIPARDIDKMKMEALKELEDMPISHAKATGKFGSIMSAMGGMAEGPEE